jgi:hypothetical protein
MLAACYRNSLWNWPLAHQRPDHSLSPPSAAVYTAIPSPTPPGSPSLPSLMVCLKVRPKIRGTSSSCFFPMPIYRVYEKAISMLS